MKKTFKKLVAWFRERRIERARRFLKRNNAYPGPTDWVPQAPVVRAFDTVMYEPLTLSAQYRFLLDEVVCPPDMTEIYKKRAVEKLKGELLSAAANVLSTEIRFDALDDPRIAEPVLRATLVLMHKKR